MHFIITGIIAVIITYYIIYFTLVGISIIVYKLFKKK